METISPFQKHGHGITIHHAALDLVMPRCSPIAWNLLCLIARKTIGWGKAEDAISYKQLKAGVGAGSNHTVSRAISELETKGLLKITRVKYTPGGKEANIYTINFAVQTIEKPLCRKCTNKYIIIIGEKINEKSPDTLQNDTREPDALDQPDQYFDYHDKRRNKAKQAEI